MTTDDFWDESTFKIGHNYDFDRVWFASNTKDETADIERLRTMPYEGYLKTPHWRRIRAAMLLLKRNRCQRCKKSFDGHETALHVHHTTYTNRGHEHYGDLLLLCKDCHKEKHSQLRQSR